MENILLSPFYLLLLLAITCDPCTILFVCINKTKLCISYAFLFKLDIMCVETDKKIFTLLLLIGSVCGKLLIVCCIRFALSVDWKCEAIVGTLTLWYKMGKFNKAI